MMDIKSPNIYVWKLALVSVVAQALQLLRMKMALCADDSGLELVSEARCER